MKTIFNRINLAIGILMLITASPVFGQEKPPQQFPGAEQRLTAPNVRTTISSVDKAGVRHIENLNMKKSRTCFANYITNMPGTAVKFKLTDHEYEAWKTLTLKILKMTPAPKFDDPEGTLIEINLLILPWERSKRGLTRSRPLEKPAKRSANQRNLAKKPLTRNP